MVDVSRKYLEMGSLLPKSTGNPKSIENANKIIINDKHSLVFNLTYISEKLLPKYTTHIQTYTP